MQYKLAEPDLFGVFKRSVWLYGLRAPFSFVFIAWITFAQSLSPFFNLEIYLYTLLATLFGLVIGAHYIDLATSSQKFSPYFKIPRYMLHIGLASVIAGFITGVYIAYRWNWLFFIFVLIETIAAITYPREIKFAHSYSTFALTWGSIPFLASYFIQAGTLNMLIVGIAVFVGFNVLMMHHIAIMTRESQDLKNSMYLLKIYMYSVYSIGSISLLGRLLAI